jgi:predicted aldo/keto reductase-like oxidoreductase
MKRSELGNTGLEVTELCFGTLIFGKLQANISPEEGARAIRRARELGINFFDTAQIYGTYPHLREGLKGDKDDLVIASKSRVKSYEEMKDAVEEALLAMELEHIDIFHLHLVKSDEDLRQREDALECLQDYKERGIISAIGISAHSPKGVKAVLDRDEIEVVFPVINKKGIGIIDGTFQEMLSVIKAAKERGKALYAMKPLGGGHLINDIKSSIDYVRGLGIFDSISVGMKTPEEVEMDVGIFEGDENYIKQAEKLGIIKRTLKRLVIYDTCIACGTCEENCDQGAIKVVDNKARVDRDKCILCGYCASSCPVFCIRVV